MEHEGAKEVVPVPFEIKMAQLLCSVVRLTEAFKRAKRGDCAWRMFIHYVFEVEEQLEAVKYRAHKLTRKERAYWEKKFEGLEINLGE